jgi:hypothetical protein
MRFRVVENCCICNRPAEPVIDLPGLPLTGIYSRAGQVPDFPTLDQVLMLCRICEHAQLLRMVDPEFLYGHDYGFRTSTSETARGSAVFFAAYLDRLCPGKRFARVLEFGCSDIVLLKRISDRADRLLGVDPVLKGREDDLNGGSISVIGAMIEDVDMRTAMGGAPDLVVSQHTLEHIPEPKRILQQLLEAGSEETLFVFEFPCLDPMLADIRFDHVFHQHVQYFSLRSIDLLLREVGAERIDHVFRPTYWGALLVAFRKAPQSGSRTKPIGPGGLPAKNVETIRARYALFRGQMEAASRLLAEHDRSVLFGYGAALMLPILGYHLGTDFSGFGAIFDDDPAKAGLGYVNLPVTIRNPDNIDLSELVVCLTALDNRRPILRRLADRNPRSIINPLCVI